MIYSACSLALPVPYLPGMASRTASTCRVTFYIRPFYFGTPHGSLRTCTPGLGSRQSLQPLQLASVTRQVWPAIHVFDVVNSMQCVWKGCS